MGMQFDDERLLTYLVIKSHRFERRLAFVETALGEILSPLNWLMGIFLAAGASAIGNRVLEWL